eukprot:CAMPEP_0182455860 /NCGR_PEP_ID=MMETSP1319-20130603/1878_1 /TAXON_ID=172717 /ORGANISM="Bolidomonas pacifica, Strain RCC208" /LENGTH=109 /DNA_ID=CAMNT_0024653993 /DNA_START=157 /DNA_END=482 /DNA_ORIENTATION=-
MQAIKLLALFALFAVCDCYLFAAVSQSTAKLAVQAVAKRIKSDRAAKSDLGNLLRINQVLGYGSPKPKLVAVRFEATFKKNGGITGDRGEMRGQVKASVEEKEGKIGKV